MKCELKSIEFTCKWKYTTNKQHDIIILSNLSTAKKKELVRELDSQTFYRRLLTDREKDRW